MFEALLYASVCDLYCRRYDPSLRKVYSTRSQVGQIHMVKSCARDSPFPPIEYLKISGRLFFFSKYYTETD